MKIFAKDRKRKLSVILASLWILVAVPLAAVPVYAVDTCGATNAVKTTIDIGCKGKGNPIADMIFAIIRILSDGVGLVVVGSLVVAGIQYSASRGDPKATANAITRIRTTVGALFLYIFAYAILNYLIPAGFFK